MSFAPGEAYQLDWSHEYADCCGRFPAGVALSMATGRCFASMSATLSAGCLLWRPVPHLFRAQGLLDLLGGDREIGAGGNPRLDLLAQAGLFEFGDGALDAVRFIKIRLDERQCLGADDATQNSLQPTALSRSWVLLVNMAGRSQLGCLYFNALGG